MFSRPSVLLVLLFAGASAARAQDDGLEISTSPARATAVDVHARDAYRVSSFSVKGRWSRDLPLPLAPGDSWTPDKQSAVLEAIRDAYDNESAFGYLFNDASTASVLYIDTDEEKDDATRTVKLTFRPLRLKLSLAKIGDNLLPIPRSPAPTRYSRVPKALLALNPVFGVTADRELGTVFSTGFQTDLRQLLAGNAAASTLPSHLDARLEASRTTENFRQLHASTTYARRLLTGVLQEWTLGAGYDDTRESFASQSVKSRGARADAGATLRLGTHARLTWNVGYAATDVSGVATAPSVTTHVQSNRLLLESQLPAPLGGFFRGAVWEDNGSTDRGFGSDQRLAARFGYAREFLVSPNQTVGLELVAGAGTRWGRAPLPRQYFGGNSASQFLYDGVNSPGLRDLPAGPLLRSFGQGAAAGDDGLSGGRNFWHVNANITLPLRRFSFPLIPDDPEIRNRLHNGINVTGRSFLITTLKNQGMTPEAARAEADRILGEIRPATSFIIEQANLYALKPLLMFDAAGLTTPTGRETWTAAGAGVQLTVVTARFELGYLHTLSGPTHGHSGNLFLRLVFQNLF